jgi:superfamily I DNA and/or RNA helicase
LLPFVSGHGNEEAISELSSITKETNKGERSIVQEALSNARTEMTGKSARIDSTRVVGVTCAATAFPIMANQRFTFVLLDECFQQTEPTSLLPIAFGCPRLVCCGDPLQLPPTLTKEAASGYGRPLFSRLMGAFPPVLLSVQYRCHPSISAICSRLFYANRVQNGVTAADRSPLFGLPTLCVFDVAYGEEQYQRGSILNMAEGITVVTLVRCLLDLGVARTDIGVIAFYRSQVETIAEPLADGSKRAIIDVSTVDAFQGDEREVIIITTAKTTKMSFVESRERINAAISRARQHLFIVTNVRPLTDSELWNVVFLIAGNEPNMRVRLDHPPDSTWRPF